MQHLKICLVIILTVSIINPFQTYPAVYLAPTGAAELNDFVHGSIRIQGTEKETERTEDNIEFVGYEEEQVQWMREINCILPHQNLTKLRKVRNRGGGYNPSERGAINVGYGDPKEEFIRMYLHELGHLQIFEEVFKKNSVKKLLSLYGTILSKGPRLRKWFTLFYSVFLVIIVPLLCVAMILNGNLSIQDLLAIFFPFNEVSTTTTIINVVFAFISIGALCFFIFKGLWFIPWLLSLFLRISIGHNDTYLRRSWMWLDCVNWGAACSPDEFPAETMAYYVVNGNKFRERAVENAALRKQYDVIKNDFFYGREYDRGQSGRVVIRKKTRSFSQDGHINLAAVKAINRAN